MKKCAKYLENEVKNLLLVDADLIPQAQTKLLEEVLPCFTDADNVILCAPPTKEDVKKTIDNSNLNAAPGNDGIPSLFYKTCWDTVGDSLTEVMEDIYKCKPLTHSQRTSLMVFGLEAKETQQFKTPGQEKNFLAEQ